MGNRFAKYVGSAAAAGAALVVALPSANATTAFIVPGTGLPGGSLPFSTGNWDDALNPQIGSTYYGCQGLCDVQVIDYPRSLWPFTGLDSPTTGQSIFTGTDTLVAEIKNTSGPIVVAGFSQGAIVADGAQARLVNDPEAPPAGDVTFIVAGDPSRGIANYLPAGLTIPILNWTVTRPPIDSQYDTIVIVGEYDGWADQPDRPWNLLADVNAVMGGEYVHSPSALSDPATVPPESITVTTNSKGATTTTYLVPTEQLPVTRPLRQLGASDPVVDRLDDVLRPAIDAGYSRNDKPGSIHLPPVQPAPSLPELSVPKILAPKVSGARGVKPASVAKPAGRPSLSRVSVPKLSLPKVKTAVAKRASEPSPESGQAQG